MKDFLYADDLVLAGDDWKEVEEKNGKMEKGIREQEIETKCKYY